MKMKKMFLILGPAALGLMMLCCAGSPTGPGGTSGNVSSTPSTRADSILPYSYYLKSVDVFPLERTILDGKTYDDRSDTLTYWIRFDAVTEYDIIKTPDHSLSKSNADTLPGLVINKTETSKSKIIINKEIYYKGNPVPAGTNLMSYSDGAYDDIFMFDLGAGLNSPSVRIRNDFYIPRGFYTVYFEWTTILEEILSDTVNVFIDLIPDWEWTFDSIPRGCRCFTVYLRNDERNTAIAVRADPESLALSKKESIFDLSVKNDDLRVSVDVFNKDPNEYTGYCNDYIVPDNPIEMTESWNAISGYIYITISIDPLDAQGYHPSTGYYVNAAIKSLIVQSSKTSRKLRAPSTIEIKNAHVGWYPG